MQLLTHTTVCRIAFVTGKELKDFREKYDLSQTELAEKLGVARNTVSRWEIEESDIPPFLALALKTIERDLNTNDISN